MDGAETLKYLSLLISQIYLYMIVQYAQLKAMKLAPHLLHTIITQSMKISLRKFTRCSRKESVLNEISSESSVMSVVQCAENLSMLIFWIKFADGEIN